MEEHHLMENAHEFLGVDPDAGFLEVERAYRWMKALYGPDSMAAYSLFDEEQRQGQLERIEDAYRTIIQGLRSRAPSTNGPRREKKKVSLSALDGSSPGLLLKQAREQAGFSLREIAERTKVSPMKLGYIEEERIDLLPAPVYLRGFVTEFAKALGLEDPGGIASLYLEKCRDLQGET